MSREWVSRVLSKCSVVQHGGLGCETTQSKYKAMTCTSASTDFSGCLSSPSFPHQDVVIRV